MEISSNLGWQEEGSRFLSLSLTQLYWSRHVFLVFSCNWLYFLMCRHFRASDRLQMSLSTSVTPRITASSPELSPYWEDLWKCLGYSTGFSSMTSLPFSSSYTLGLIQSIVLKCASQLWMGQNWIRICFTPPPSASCRVEVSYLPLTFSGQTLKMSLLNAT